MNGVNVNCNQQTGSKVGVFQTAHPTTVNEAHHTVTISQSDTKSYNYGTVGWNWQSLLCNIINIIMMQPLEIMPRYYNTWLNAIVKSLCRIQFHGDRTTSYTHIEL